MAMDPAAGFWDRAWDAAKWLLGLCGVALLAVWRTLEGRVQGLEDHQRGAETQVGEHKTDLAVLKSRFDGLESALNEHRDETRSGFAAVLDRLDMLYYRPKPRTKRKTVQGKGR